MVAEAARELMDAVVPLLAAVLGGLVAYWLSGSRARTEWRHQKRAEVLAEIYQQVSKAQTTAQLATLPDVPLEIRRERVTGNREALGELVLYLHANTLWIDARTLPTIAAFVNGLASALQHYEAEINKGTHNSPLAVQAAEHVQRIVPEAERVLEAEFRAIVDPLPWYYEYPLRALEWLDKLRGRSAGGA